MRDPGNKIEFKFALANVRFKLHNFQDPMQFLFTTPNIIMMPGGGVLPYMGFIGICGMCGVWFFSRFGHKLILAIWPPFWSSSIWFFFSKKLLLHQALLLPSALCLPLLG